MRNWPKCTLLLPPSPPSSFQPAPPDPWNELAAFRETTLRFFTRPEDRKALEHLGAYFTESALEQNHLWPSMPGSETVSATRAVYRDLLFALHYLRRIGDARTQSSLPQPEHVLAAIADRTARRLLPEVIRLRQAIERCEAAGGRVN
jgi:hypothetical protein